jgi:glucuronosyltransferase
MTKFRSFLACVLIILASVVLVSGKKILIITIMLKSRVLQANAIAEGLIDNGHQVYMLMDTKFKPPTIMNKAGIHFVHYRSSGAGEELFSTSDACQKTLFEVSFTDSTYTKIVKLMPMFLELLGEFCDVVQNKTLLAELKDLKPDIVVMDATSRCLYLIPHNLGVPYVNFMPMLLADMTAPALHAPLLSSGPADNVYYGHNTLRQRTFKALIVTILGPIFEYVTAYPSDKPYTSFRDLADKALLHLLDTARVYEVPIPSSPNLINVGGLVTKPAKQLTEGPLKDFIDSSEGFVLVTFGGVAVHFPDNIVEELFSAIGRLKLKAVLQFNIDNLKENQKLPSNTFASKWLPQNDLLGHKKMKVFVTHCGNSGQHEALYHGVPMLGLPIFGDQAYNAERFASKGFGLYINLRDLRAEDFVSNITELVQNQSYKEAITKASEMYRDQLMTPKQTAAYWIDHVMKYGADHMLSYTNQLAWYQILMLDVIAFTLCLITVICAMLYAGCRCCCWLFCTRRQKKEKTS